MAEIITKDRKEYNIWDKINSKWNRLNFLTNAKSVDFDDGKTAQNKLGAIDGITSDLSGESETVAASIKCVNQLNSSLTDLGGFKPVIDESSGEITGYKTTIGGADTVFPFSKGSIKYGGYVKGDLAGINTFKADSPIKSITISNMYYSNTIILHTALIFIDEKSIIYDGNDKSSLFDSCISVADNGLTVSVSHNVFTEGKYWPYIACITI